MKATLSQARAHLLDAIRGLDAATLAQPVDASGWTAKDALVHVAAWDEEHARRLRLVAAGREGEIVPTPWEVLHARNAELLAARAGWSAAQALATCLAARSEFLDALDLIGDENLYRPLAAGDVTVAQWTERRALHDQAHAAPILAWRQTLDLPQAVDGKASYLAQLCAERADLLAQLVNLPEEMLVGRPVVGDSTVKDLLAHTAYWDRWVLRTMMAMHAGLDPDLSELRDVDLANAAAAENWRDRSLAEVMAELLEARANWLAWLGLLPDEAFFRSRFVGDQDWSFPGLTRFQWQHDAEHAGHIAAWRETAKPPRRPGPKGVLQAALATARRALLTEAATIPLADRSRRALTGEWTLKDILGHIADWEAWVLDALTQMAAGRAPAVEGFESIQAWNEAHASARAFQPWDVVWGDFIRNRAALAAVLDGMSQDQLEQPYPTSWSSHDLPPYAWLTVVLLDHDLEHGHDLMATMAGWEGRTAS